MSPVPSLIWKIPLPRAPKEPVTRPATVTSLPTYRPGSRLILAMLVRVGQPARRRIPPTRRMAWAILLCVFTPILRFRKLKYAVPLGRIHRIRVGCAATIPVMAALGGSIISVFCLVRLSDGFQKVSLGSSVGLPACPAIDGAGSEQFETQAAGGGDRRKRHGTGRYSSLTGQG